MNVAKLAEKFPHKIVQSNEKLNTPIDDFNCVMYALGLIGRLEQLRDANREFRIGTPFVTDLIANAAIKRCAESIGSLAVWSCNGKVKHIGVVVGNGRIVSKWGEGCLWEHGLFEVPQNYGDDLTFFEAVTPESMWEQFTRYESQKSTVASKA